MQSDGKSSGNDGLAGPSNPHRTRNEKGSADESRDVQALELSGSLAGPSGDATLWYTGQVPPAGQFTYPHGYPYGPGDYSLPPYPFQPQPDHPSQHQSMQQPQAPYSLQPLSYPQGPPYPQPQPFDDPLERDRHFHNSANWISETSLPAPSGQQDYPQLVSNSYGLIALDLEAGQSLPVSAPSPQSYANNLTHQQIESQFIATPSINSPPKRPLRASERRRGGSAAPVLTSRTSERSGPRPGVQRNEQPAASSSASTSTAWPDGSSTAVSFSGSFDPGRYGDGFRKTSATSQNAVTQDATDLSADVLADDNPRGVKSTRRSKRKSEGSMAQTGDEEDEEPDESGDAHAGESRVNKRRTQNKLAQRAFRARTKIQNVEVNSQIAHLMQANESQSRRLEEMSALVASLQRENQQLRLARAAEATDPHVDPPSEKHTSGQKPP